MSKPTVARLSSPAQLVAALPLYLGYVPSESLVVVCQHEPRGRIGLTMRFDLPPQELEAALVEQVVARVRRQQATRVLLAVYTSEPDAPALPRALLVEDLVDELEEIETTDALLVRDGRFRSYLCENERCCPREGRPVHEASDDDQVGLLAAELVVQGQALLPSREALAASLAGPTFLAAEEAGQRCEAALDELLEAREDDDAREEYLDRLVAMWVLTAARVAHPPFALHPDDAAALAVSLGDKVLRDVLAARHAMPGMVPLLAELCRRTPSPWDVPVCTLFAWASYCEGGGAQVTIALDRALAADPDYSLATLLGEVLNGQYPPDVISRITRDAVSGEADRWAC